jgi:hypothetical protein
MNVGPEKRKEPEVDVLDEIVRTHPLNIVKSFEESFGLQPFIILIHESNV